MLELKTISVVLEAVRWKYFSLQWKFRCGYGWCLFLLVSQADNATCHWSVLGSSCVHVEFISKKWPETYFSFSVCRGVLHRNRNRKVRAWYLQFSSFAFSSFLSSSVNHLKTPPIYHMCQQILETEMSLLSDPGSQGSHQYLASLLSLLDVGEWMN